MAFSSMIDAAAAGTLKAMVVVGDNPLMFAPGTSTVRQALEKLELLIVIDSVMTDTAKLAHCVFADVPTYAKTGSFSNAERRVNRLHAALDALADARPALLALTDLANAIGGADTWAYDHPDDVTDEIAATVPGYEPFSSQFERWGKTRVTGAVTKSEQHPVGAQAAAPSTTGDLLLTTGRTPVSRARPSAHPMPISCTARSTSSCTRPTPRRCESMTARPSRSSQSAASYRSRRKSAIVWPRASPSCRTTTAAAPSVRCCLETARRSPCG
jgi:NADH dehydrogenase/NADH:ubiquinone oxidoreductase subunit G